MLSIVESSAPGDRFSSENDLQAFVKETLCLGKLDRGKPVEESEGDKESPFWIGAFCPYESDEAVYLLFRSDTKFQRDSAQINFTAGIREDELFEFKESVGLVKG